MSEQVRSLPKIAYGTFSIPNYPIDSSMIDASLIEAGLDPQDERERTRFRKMVELDAHLIDWTLKPVVSMRQKRESNLAMMLSSGR